MKTKRQSWSKRNPEKARAASRKWKAENPEKVNASQRRRYAENPGKVLAQKRRWREENPEKAKAAYRKWRNNNPEKARQAARARHLRGEYGITETDYQKRYREQAGRCAICGKEFARLCVDHDHATGKVRGLLCAIHNSLLGFSEDSPDLLRQAAKYLTKHQTNRK